MRNACALPLVLAVHGAGCSKPEANLIGKWQADAGSMKTGKSQSDAMAETIAKNMTIEFKTDKTFSMRSLMEGTYVVSGHTVTMTETKAMGMDVAQLPNKSNIKPVVATMSDDGKSFTITPGTKAIKFIKSAVSGS